MANKKKEEIGNGWINKRGKKMYLVTKVNGTKINEEGRIVIDRKYFYGNTKKEALEKLAEFEEQKKLNLSDNKKSFRVLADEWIRTYYLKNFSKNKSQRTKECYLSAFNTHIMPRAICDKRPSEISRKDWQMVINALFDQHVPNTTIRRAINLLKHFYNFLEEEDICRNIVASISIPKKPSRNNESITIWTDEEITKILGGFDNLPKQNSHTRIRFLLNVAYFTGMRISEIIGLKYEDFTENGIRVQRQIQRQFVYNADGTKTSFLGVDDYMKTNNSYRLIPMNERLRKEFEIHKRWQLKESIANGYRTDFVFTTDSGSFYDRANLDRAAKRYYKAIGIDSEGRRFHTYRHTFGTNLCRADVPIQEASKLLGHSDISVTLKYYVNVGIEAKKQAIEKLSLFVG